jgi:hypothetical protein
MFQTGWKERKQTAWNNLRKDHQVDSQDSMYQNDLVWIGMAA